MENQIVSGYFFPAIVHSKGITVRIVSCNSDIHYEQSTIFQVELIFLEDIYAAIKMLATPTENSVVCVRVAVEA